MEDSARKQICKKVQAPAFLNDKAHCLEFALQFARSKQL
jgi:hypothetical protein